MQPLTTPATTTIEEYGSISGTIRDTAGEPVGGVKVYVIDSNTNIMGGFDNWSDAEGNYHVNKVPTGDYYVMLFIEEVYAYNDADPWEGRSSPGPCRCIR